MRHISGPGLELIKHFERFYSVRYFCPARIWPIGFGHVILPGEIFNEPIDIDLGITILRKDLTCAERSVLRLICVPLEDGQFDALTSFSFNLGGGSLQRSALRSRVNREDAAADVAMEFMRWVWAGGRKLNGLIRRRRAEADLYRYGQFAL